MKRTLWTDEQFERRLNRRITLPDEHSKEDMLKIARSHLPGGDAHSLKLLAGYALGTEKKQASGIVEALESARYRAEHEAALIHDHKFLNPAPTADLQSARTSIARPVKRSGDGAARLPISSPGCAGGGDSDFPISRRLGRRITTSIAT